MDITKTYGPPGTGKTTYLISTLEEEFSNGLEPSQVAYLTFSRSASEEARGRILERSSGRMTEDELTWFRTIHSTCFKLLGHVERHNLFSEQHQADFSERTGYKITNDHDYGELFFTDDDYTICLQARSLAAARGVSIFDVIKEMGDHEALNRIDQFLRTYLGFKSEQGLYDFLDMLTEYLDNPTPLSEHGVRVVLLDEAQDLSKLQWKIFRNMIRGAERVYIAGDDDQSIYNFIGADPDSFNEFPADTVRVLEKSYRVPAAIGRRADKVIAQVSHRMEKNVQWAEREGEIYSGPRLVENLDIRPDKTTLILCRHRRQVLSVSKKLIHIPHALDRMAISNSRLSHVFAAHMDLLENKEVEMGRVSRLMKYLKIKWSIINGKSTYRFDDIPELRSVEPLWKSGKPGDVVIFGHLWNYWRKGYPLNVMPNLRIMTMHAAKGQEADDVFILPDCNDTVYERRNTDAELRLMYVALTRAKERCIVCAPRTDKYLKGLMQ